MRISAAKSTAERLSELDKKFGTLIDTHPQLVGWVVVEVMKRRAASALALFCISGCASFAAEPS
jgi:hypothetical protein